MTPLLASNLEQKITRWLCSLRSSFEKPKSLLKPLRISSPSITSMNLEFSSRFTSPWASVVLPLPERPVNQMQNPCSIDINPICRHLMKGFSKFSIVFATSLLIMSNGGGSPFNSNSLIFLPAKLTMSSPSCGHTLSLAIFPHFLQ